MPQCRDYSVEGISQDPINPLNNRTIMSFRISFRFLIQISYT